MDVSLSSDNLINQSKSFIEFGKYFLGLINRPYQTYRNISLNKPYSQLIFIAFLIAIYLSLSTLAKESLLANPFFLTKSLVKVGLVIAFTYFFVGAAIYQVSKYFGGVGRLYDVLLLWAFSLLPTLSWFLLTTVFYELVPPPRTFSLKGQAFSLVFLTFSLGCLFWKGILYYLTLRIGMRLNAKRIMLTSFVILPFIFGYSYLLFKLKIFGVPFI